MKTHNRTLQILVLTLALLGLGPLMGSAQDSSLVNLLVQQLGVTQTQAQGGTGALFSLAKEKLSPKEFGQVADTVPEMETLLEAAPHKKSGLSDLLGKGSSLFSGETKQNLEGGLDLADSFSQLGLSPDMMSQFVPVILDYVQSKGGDTVKNLLAAALL